MRIKQLKLNNIGPFIGERCFSFHTDNPQKQIVLIGGRNGAGKTTLFESIRLCLYGYKLYGYRQNSRTYTDKIKKLINDQSKTASPAVAEISMQILMEDGYANNIFEIKRKWILNGNSFEEELRIYKDEKLLTSEQMQDFDSYLMQLIPPALFNFHFFDGEKISDFVFDHTNSQAFRKAFLQICGLDTFDLIEEQLQDNIRVSKGNAKKDVQSEYESAKSELTKMKETWTQINNTVKKFTLKIADIKEKIASLDQEMQRYGGVENHKWKIYEQELKEEENKRDELRHMLKASANDVVPFIILKDQLEELRQQLVNEDKLRKNRLFREKLSDPFLKGKLRKELGSFLMPPNSEISEEFLTALYKVLSEDISENESEILDVSENDTVDLSAKIHYFQNYDIQKLIEAEQALEDSLEHTKQLRAKMDSKEEISSDRYLVQKNDLLMQLDSARQKLMEEKDNLSRTEESLKDAQKKYQKAYEDYKAMLKERSVTDMAARALLAFEELKQNLYAKYVAKVEQSFSRNFHRLISKTDLIDGIYIDSQFEVIAYKNLNIEIADFWKRVKEFGEESVCDAVGERACEMIKNYGRFSGEILVPVKVEQHFSAGEKQIFVMALYQSLAEIRTSELPFVIDTPLARIDSEHRKNILNCFFCRLPGQVIILSTDEEIDTESVGLLLDKISDVYLIEHGENGISSVQKDSYF